MYVEAAKPRRLWIDPCSGRIVTDSEEPGTPTAFGESLPSTRLAESGVPPGGYRSIDSLVAAANTAFPSGLVTRVRVALKIEVLDVDLAGRTRYILHYNRTRIHSALGFRSPIDYERLAA